MLYYFKVFSKFHYLQLLKKGYSINIIFFFIVLFFLFKIAIPDGLSLLVMFLITRDNIDKFLAEEYHFGNVPLYILNIGNINKFLFSKLLGFIASYGAIIYIFSCLIDYFIYGRFSVVICIIIGLALLVFSSILALCSSLLIANNKAHEIMNLIFIPFAIPIFLLHVLTLNSPIILYKVIVIDLCLLVVLFILMSINLKNTLSN